MASKSTMFPRLAGTLVYQVKRITNGSGIISGKEKALVNSKPCPQHPKIRVPEHVEDLIIHLRTTYHLGQLRISWYLKRYHNIKVSQSGVYSVLRRNGLNKLPQHQRKRSMEPLNAMKSRCLATAFNWMSSFFSSRIFSPVER